MKAISQLQFGAAWWFVALSLISCEPKKPRVEQAPDTSTHIDSEISVDSVRSITKKTTVRDFLLALNLYENADLPENVLDDELLILVEFEGRENIVNEWSLAGGGGIRFTTRYNSEDEEQ